MIMIKCDKCGAIEPADMSDGISFKLPEGWIRVFPDFLLSLHGAIEKHFCRACAERIISRTEADA